MQKIALTRAQGEQSMSEGLSHEEIAQRFVESKTIDFEAMGRFVSQYGAALTLADKGWHGVNFGRFNVLACMLRAEDVLQTVGNLRAAGLTASIVERLASPGALSK
jgi:hypothetical protein